MDCVVMAGGIPDPEDPIYAYSQGKPKALISMAGRTMVEHVVKALQGSIYIDEVVIVGISAETAAAEGLTFDRPVHHIPDQGGLVSNALAGANWCMERADKPAVLFASADIPLLTADMVNRYLEACQPYDRGLYYTGVTQETMERRFPNSNRTYVKLKGLRFAGGDLTLLRTEIIAGNEPLWEALANARKHAWRLARIVGLGVLFKYLTRRLSTSDIEDLVGKITGIPGRFLLVEDAELAMDGDKPGQIERLRAEMEGTG